jgi:hypothetical protein
MRTDHFRQACESIRVHRIRYSASDPCLSIKSNRFAPLIAKKICARRFPATIANAKRRGITDAALWKF